MTTPATEPAVNTTPAPGQDLLLDVDVTQGCIDLGMPDACTECPIALALLRSLAAAGIVASSNLSVNVQHDSVTVRLADGRIYGGELDSDQRDFIVQFDSHDFDSIAPHRFRLQLAQYAPTLPDRIERLIAASRADLDQAQPPAEG